MVACSERVAERLLVLYLTLTILASQPEGAGWFGTPMNPYEVQTQCTPAPSENELPKPRRFRWFVIPAAVSWCIGGVTLVALPIGLYRAIGLFIPAAAANWPRHMSLFQLIMTMTALFVAGLLNMRAGFHWVGGRWLIALILNGVAFGIMGMVS